MDTTLIVPGLHGSGPTIGSRGSSARSPIACASCRATGERPICRSGRQSCAASSTALRAACGSSPIASDASPPCRRHSTTGERISGLMLVAPADPDALRVRSRDKRTPARRALDHRRQHQRSLDVVRPCRRMGGSLGSELLSLGTAGHVNVEAGYGAWPRGLDIYWSLRTRRADQCSRRAKRMSLSLESLMHEGDLTLRQSGGGAATADRRSRPRDVGRHHQVLMAARSTHLNK